MTGHYSHIPELSLSDLDDDGDLDIVVSRVGYLYVGTAIQIIENRGHGDFVSKLFPVVEAPSDYEPDHEGNEWNSFATAIRFADVDSDQDTDIILFGGGYVGGPHEKKVRGAIFRNEGHV